MESPIYHPRANGQAERAVQTVKLAKKAWGKHSSVIFCVFPTSTNGAWKNGKIPWQGENTMRTCSWTKNQINYHRRFWRMRTNSLQAEQNTETQPAIFIIWCGINTSWIQPKRSERTVLVSDKQIARFSQETNTTDGTSDIVVIEIQCTMKMNNNQTINLNRSQTNLIDLQDSGNQRNTTEILYRQTFLEKEGRCDGLRSRPIWSAMQLICMGRCRRKSKMLLISMPSNRGTATGTKKRAGLEIQATTTKHRMRVLEDIFISERIIALEIYNSIFCKQ